MTPEEALVRIRTHNKIHSRKEKYFAVHITKALNLATEALEKQIPKKGRYTYLSSYTDDPPVMICPCCQNTHPSAAAILYKYCFYCGQALDWSGDTV